MKPTLAFAAFVTLLSVATAARTGPGEHWVTVMKEEAMPEVIRDLVHLNSETEVDHECDTKTSTDHGSVKLVHVHDQEKEKKGFSDEFEPRPSASSYGGDGKLENKRNYGDDFEPRPSATSYGNDDKFEKKRNYADDFEPRPSASSYGGDDKVETKRKYADDFEPRPNLSAYGGDDKVEKILIVENV